MVIFVTCNCRHELRVTGVFPIWIFSLNSLNSLNSTKLKLCKTFFFNLVIKILFCKTMIIIEDFSFH